MATRKEQTSSCPHCGNWDGSHRPNCIGIAGDAPLPLGKPRRIMREPDDKTRPELIDYETAMFITSDIENRTPSNVPFVLAQWVYLIRKHERETKID